MRSHAIVVSLVALAIALTPVRPRAAVDRPVSLMAIAPSDVRAVDGMITQGLRDDTLRLRETVHDSVLAGRSHERLDQYYAGVRVFGGDIVRQIASRGETVSVFGQMYPQIRVDTTATLTVDDAIARMRGAMATSGTVRDRELVILPLISGDYALAYRILVKTRTDRVMGFVDAHSGAVLQQFSNLQRAGIVEKGTGVFGEALKVSATAMSGVYLAEDRLRPAEIETFDMHGNVTKTLNFLGGLVDLTESDVATSTSTAWTDGPAVDAHVYAGYTYDYYYQRFGRHGLDDHDLGEVVLVHPVNRSDLATASNDVVGALYLNAFYAGDGTVVYGEGLPSNLVLASTRQTVNYFSAGLDIVAHELSHGVTEYSSGLIYQDESGALNEAFSDIMGISAKFFFQPPGSGLMQASYELGADVIRPGGIRSFDNPAVFGDPDHYSRRLVTNDDNGGVHTNCTIADHAFYLAIEGGTDRTSGLAVQGVGASNRLQIERVFYRGFTAMLPSGATFSMARAATVQAASDLYGSTSAAYRAVTQAWAAVGVL